MLKLFQLALQNQHRSDVHFVTDSLREPKITLDLYTKVFLQVTNPTIWDGAEEIDKVQMSSTKVLNALL